MKRRPSGLPSDPEAHADRIVEFCNKKPHPLVGLFPWSLDRQRQVMRRLALRDHLGDFAPEEIHFVTALGASPGLFPARLRPAAIRISLAAKLRACVHVFRKMKDMADAGSTDLYRYAGYFLWALHPWITQEADQQPDRRHAERAAAIGEAVRWSLSTSGWTWPEITMEDLEVTAARFDPSARRALERVQPLLVPEAEYLAAELFNIASRAAGGAAEQTKAVKAEVSGRRSRYKKHDPETVFGLIAVAARRDPGILSSPTRMAAAVGISASTLRSWLTSGKLDLSSIQEAFRAEAPPRGSKHGEGRLEAIDPGPAEAG
jgi:hypothetical protein